MTYIPTYLCFYSFNALRVFLYYLIGDLLLFLFQYQRGLSVFFGGIPTSSNKRIFQKRASEFKDHPTHATHVAETKIVVSKLALDNHTSSPWHITAIVPGVYIVQKMTSTSWFFRSIWSHSCQFTCAHLLPRFDWQSPQIRSNCGTSICWRETFDAFNKQKYNQGVKTVHQVGWSPKWTPPTRPSWNQPLIIPNPRSRFASPWV